MELHFPVPTSGQEDPLECLRPGYAHLLPVGSDIGAVNGQKKLGRFTTMLEKLHRPFNERILRIKLPLEKQHIRLCTKLQFLMWILERIKSLGINLDVAIVCSSEKEENETVLVQAMELYDMEYMALSKFPPAEGIPFWGVLVRFRKKQTKKPHFRMRVDYIIVYEPALAPDTATILDYFSGVYYDKPQIVSLVCLQTLDIRICNFRHEKPHIPLNPSVPLIQDKQGLSVLIKNTKCVKISQMHRSDHNIIILTMLVHWITLKDGSVFNSKDSKYDAMIKSGDLQPWIPRQNPAELQILNPIQKRSLQASTLLKLGTMTANSSNNSIVIDPTLKSSSTPEKPSHKRLLDEENEGINGESKKRAKRLKLKKASNTVNGENSSTGETMNSEDTASAVEPNGTAENDLESGMFEFESVLDKALEDLKSFIEG